MIDYPAYFSKWQNFKTELDFAGMLSLNEKPIVDLINERGLNISSIWKDLVNPSPLVKGNLNNISDILFNAIDDESIHPRISAGIVRTIGNKEIVNKHDYYKDLFYRYIKVPPSAELHNPQCRGLDQGFAFAISNHFKIDYLIDHLELMYNDKLGESRSLLLLAFKKHLKNSVIKDILINLSKMSLYQYEAKVLLKKAYNYEKQIG